MKEKCQIRVRIAPSPTGFFHLGTVRTALFNYLFAKNPSTSSGRKGKFILRIDDTDKKRSEKKYEKDIIENLKWLGLNWDEGPYRQSERTEIYQKYLKKLLESGQAFWCYHTKEELEKEKQEQMKRKEAPRHICDKKRAALKKFEGCPRGVIRFRCPDKKIIFNDLIRGKLEFEAGLLGDISIAKDEKTPLFLLAGAVDDYEMKISHIIRGEDHLSNTPKQILLAEALGFEPPEYGHLPLILGPDKSKLSKRHGAMAINEYKKQGYLPQTLLNFLALLGWNPGSEKEIFSLNELIKEFSLERVQKGGAVFNQQRLDWLNGYYIRQMDLDELTEKCLPFLSSVIASEAKQSHKESNEIASVASLPRNDRKKTAPQNDRKNIPRDSSGSALRMTKKKKNSKEFQYLKKIVALEQERLKKLSEIGELTDFFFKNKLDYQLELLKWKDMSLGKVKKNLDIVYKGLSKIDKFDQKTLQEILMPLTEKYGRGELLWPLRAALSGKKASPGPFEIMEILGKKKTLKRIKEAIERIK